MAKIRTIADLRKELSAKERQLEKLQAKRDQLSLQLEEVDKQIASLTGKTPQRKARSNKAGKKPKQSIGKESLGDVLAKALKDKGTVKVADAAQMAIAAGYKTQSKQFANIVSHTLANDDRFRKTRRGLFKVK